MLQKKHFKVLKENFPLFCRTCLKIRAKSGDIIPLTMNDAQLYFYERLEDQRKRTGKVRLVVLKGRQQGLSTIIEAWCFHKVIFNKGLRAFILTHGKDATANIFDMVQRYLENLPFVDMLPRKTDSANELYFDGLDSGYKIGTAGNKTVGRSQTVQLFHGSEAAFWENAPEHAAGILQTIPDGDNTAVIFESTANGIGNFFYQKYKECLAGGGEMELVFIPWFWQKEYLRPLDKEFRLTEEEKEIKKLYELSDEQLSWRRNKIKQLGADVMFKQEYPNTAEEAFIATNFDAYLDVNLIKKSMNHKEYVEAYGPLILGVDPSSVGKDKTAFCLRRGRVVEKIWAVDTKDEMEVVGHIVKLLNEKSIKYCFIDKIGIGAGIVSRLLELNYRVIPVNASERAMDAEINHNLRAEMWRKTKEWLEDEPAVLPDDPELLNQLCSVGSLVDSKSRLQIEKKDDIKKDGRPSPDKADALTYTFARPVNLQQGAIKYTEKGIV